MGVDYKNPSYLYLDSSLAAGKRDVTPEELEKAANSTVLKVDSFKDPVIIESMELLFNNGTYFLRTRSRDGAEGVAVVYERAAYLYTILHHLIIPYFIGKDARQLEALLDGVYVYKSNYKLQGLAYWCCISWVETSILDMLGRISGKPAAELLGTILRDEIPLYVASGNRGTTPEEEVDILLKRMAETGAKAVKFKVGGRMSKNSDSIKGRSEGLIQLARKRLGDNIDIHADGNGSYDPPVAIEYAKMLEEIKAFFYEEPCPFDHLEDTREVAHSINIPLAFGEQETSMRRFRWIVANRAATVVQPDLQYNGGFIKTTRVARMAALAGMAITPHISSGIGYLYVAVFASYIPNIGKYQEHKAGVKDTGMLFTPKFEVKDGIMKAPRGPGFGMDPAAVNDVLRKALVIK